MPNFVTYPGPLFHSFYLLNMNLNHNHIISMPNHQHSNFAVALSILTTRGSAITVNCHELLEVGLLVKPLSEVINCFYLILYNVLKSSL